MNSITEHTNRVRQLETELDNGLKKLEDIRSYQRDGGLEDHERLLQQTIRERDDLAAAHQRQLDRIQERFEKYIAITNRKIDDEFKAIDKAARNVRRNLECALSNETSILTLTCCSSALNKKRQPTPYRKCTTTSNSVKI